MHIIELLKTLPLVTSLITDLELAQPNYVVNYIEIELLFKALLNIISTFF